MTTANRATINSVGDWGGDEAKAAECWNTYVAPALDALEVARQVIRHGTPYTTHRTHEGSDYFFSTTQVGLRWGKIKLQVQANGSLVLYGEGKRGYPLGWTTIFDSSSTGQYLGHWDSIERRVLRTAVRQRVILERQVAHG